ncbi:hypothetical protein E8E13_011337 [Curvularia kusanoi]|uniref:Protein kinase domain-containing protein n=1 Tax=Curvularia kusanoi TaxID=90978 RepID=A0A9P4TP53_CURKU|nr:hypothetical protein E8E13_011337 [Curvularia kusanoi]
MSSVPLPDEYVYVAPAGKGANAAVQLCLPTVKVKRFIELDRQPSHPAFSSRMQNLKQSLVAVKVALPQDKSNLLASDVPSWITKKVHDKDELIKTEYEALSGIKDSTAVNAAVMRAYFPELKQTGPKTFRVGLEDRPCVVLEAIVPSVTLSDIRYSRERGVTENKLPAALTYQLLYCLGPALHFLRYEMKWTHRDIKDDNIILRPRMDKHGLPQFVLIDFGLARPVGSAQGFPDGRDFLRIVWGLSKEAEGEENQGWKIFCATIDELVKNLYTVAGETFQSTWKKLIEIADKERATRDGHAAKIQEIYENIVQREQKFENNDSDEHILREAVDKYRGSLT